MTARLIETREGGTRRREITMRDGDFVIGRGADCDLRLPVSAISRQHCLIRVQGQEATLVDLDSSNGTFLNGRPVRTVTPLSSGDEIRVGACFFIVDLSNSPIVPEPGGDPNAGTMKLRGVDKARDHRPAPLTPDEPTAGPEALAGTGRPDRGATSQSNPENADPALQGAANWSSYNQNLLEAFLDV